MTYWPNDIGRRAEDAERLQAAEAATDIGADNPSDDNSIEMLGRLLLWAMGAVVTAAMVVIWVVA